MQVRAAFAKKVALALAVLAPVAPAAVGCSVGTGAGTVSGTLDVPDCWSGKFNLGPNFFAADPYQSSLTIRVQSGGDYASFSDGISILVDNVHEIRGDSPYSPSLLGQALEVSLPQGVAVEGEPVVPQPDPSIVHLTLYLQKSCPTQNVSLYAMESVSVNEDGNCNPAPTGPYILACNAPGAVGLTAVSDAGSGASTVIDGGAGKVDASLRGEDAGYSEAGTLLPASPPVKHSTITFQSLFDGNIDETGAGNRLTSATFDVYLADPRDACSGGSGPPPPCRGHLTGSFQFYFERGQPGQPFP